MSTVREVVDLRNPLFMHYPNNYLNDRPAIQVIDLSNPLVMHYSNDPFDNRPAIQVIDLSQAINLSQHYPGNTNSLTPIVKDEGIDIS